MLINKKKILIISSAVVLAVALVVLFFVFYEYDDYDGSIPRLYLEGNISNMYEKSDVRNISVRYRDKDFSFSGYAELKIQGGSSLEYKKKNYNIKLFNDSDHKNKMKVDLGWGEENKYCLKANWIDKTHSRNIVTANLVSDIQKEYGVLNQAPENCSVDGFPVEVYSNGKFLGIYTLNIPKDEWLFGMNKKNPNHIVFSSEEWERESMFKEMPTYQGWSLEVGQENQEPMKKLERLFNFVINSNDEEFRNNFEQYMSLDAALNYYIISDFACLRDNTGKNMLLATYDGEKWYPVLYDLDTSWGVDFTGLRTYDYTDAMNGQENNKLFSKIKRVFGKELSERYFELRREYLTKESIMERFNQFEGLIPQKVLDKEKRKWGDEIPGYPISQIEEYLDIMIPVFDEKYESIGNKAIYN